MTDEEKLAKKRKYQREYHRKYYYKKIGKLEKENQEVDIVPNKEYHIKTRQEKDMELYERRKKSFYELPVKKQQKALERFGSVDNFCKNILILQ